MPGQPTVACLRGHRHVSSLASGALERQRSSYERHVDSFIHPFGITVPVVSTCLSIHYSQLLHLSSINFRRQQRLYQAAKMSAPDPGPLSSTSYTLHKLFNFSTSRRSSPSIPSILAARPKAAADILPPPCEWPNFASRPIRLLSMCSRPR